MSSDKALSPEQLCWQCNPEQFSFNTTDDLEELTDAVGQERALEAVRFGMGIRRPGYNLFVMGPSGMGRHTLVQRYLEQKSAHEDVPDDWCYVHNFEQAHKPNAIQLPSGRARALENDMAQLVEDLKSAIPTAFEAEDYRLRSQEIEDAFKEHQETTFNSIQKEAEEHNITLMRTPSGFSFAPLRDGKVMKPGEFNKLPDKEREKIEAITETLQESLQNVVDQMPLWAKESREKLRELNREVTTYAVGSLIDQLRDRYNSLPEVISYLDEVQQDVVDNSSDFLRSDEDRTPIFMAESTPSFNRYQVNVLVDNTRTEGAPVIYEDNPMFNNLVGRVEHQSQMGTLVTDFTLIKPGALHRANGGYLVLDAKKVLTSPYAWEGLKRILFSNEVRIESLGQVLSLISTVSLEPESIPLDVKVVLIGDRYLYYLLYEYDQDMAELFKVEADFENSIDRNEENSMLFARYIATLARREEMLAFDCSAVARILENSARIEEDSKKFSTHMQSMADLLRESDYWARDAGRKTVMADDVQQAINAQIQRSDRIHQHMLENIDRGVTLIDTDGARVGQVNGLTVIELGGMIFGQPSRITATARMGENEITDIEDEVELGGAIHSKGMLILTSFLGSRYAKEYPIPINASVTFEQSYGHVEGDSASMGELCALLSAISKIPIKQSLAITGSVNQHGKVQAIGGINEKIEGYFDVCVARGLNGEHGVIVPDSNIQHLMLRHDVVEAVKQGKFNIYAMNSIDDALELLMGMSVGERDENDEYPEGTINHAVESTLKHLAEVKREFSDGKHKEEEHEPEIQAEHD